MKNLSLSESSACSGSIRIRVGSPKSILLQTLSLSCTAVIWILELPDGLPAVVIRLAVLSSSYPPFDLRPEDAVWEKTVTTFLTLILLLFPRLFLALQITPPSGPDLAQRLTTRGLKCLC